ncbi:hypothetical protein ACEWY4_010992 [Coilia grayii]|uniref:Cilia- and flagella-associated protein 263 n=1 Tax=Coilia grayii TaxID=363190 RepID=A0ABD1K3G2_9TELE
MADFENSEELEDKRRVIELIDNLRRSNAVLRAETDMFERHLGRMEPRELAAQGGPEGTPDMVNGMKSTRSRTMTQEKLQQLTLEQKCDVALREMDEMREDLEKLKNSSERMILNLKATLEEADVRLVEVKKTSNEFDRDVAKVLREKKGAMMGAEKVIRYFEDRMRAKDTLVEKLRLKNAALHVQKRKLILQMRQKEEMGEVLHEVDFQQLKIENTQYIERIDERNQDLLRFKLLAGNTLQILNLYKKKLQNMTCESKLLSSDIASRREMLVKIEEETEQAEEERMKAEVLNKKLRGELADYRVPPVLQYVTTKASHTQLEQAVKAWERKVEISEMALKTHTKAWNKLRAIAAGAEGASS